MNAVTTTTKQDAQVQTEEEQTTDEDPVYDRLFNASLNNTCLFCCSALVKGKGVRYCSCIQFRQTNIRVIIKSITESLMNEMTANTLHSDVANRIIDNCYYNVVRNVKQASVSQR
jgi:hypothetical protein